MLTKLCLGFILSLPVALGHGIVSNPPAEFDPSKMRTTYVATIQANLPGKFDGSPDANARAFSDAFKAQSTYKTLRDMLEPHGPSCGYSLTNVSKKPIPFDNTMTWQNPDSGEGFVSSHTGPCEVWLDDKLVFQNDNCATNFPSKPAAHLPVDYSSCSSNGCLLRFYWIALHQPLWQVYKNCVPLAGHGVKAIAHSASGVNKVPYSMCSSVEPNTDYEGGDLVHVTVNGDQNAQETACCEACKSTSGCIGFSLKDTVCYLKNMITTPSTKGDVVSSRIGQLHLRK
ncbi:hypothetical protein THRCLA_03633 [Thraustotheca clavata]|uniref:Secreted protein n=1 Tax=Thraustotheca clavata TaxID=74557 RepID=A0A0A7CLS4_9STRA|nr:secreted protein [Thraustotheca clavata]OQS04091.1 hypothetical protein THRCLA_03633 [Thraustotheca clavata]